MNSLNIHSAEAFTAVTLIVAITLYQLVNAVAGHWRRVKSAEQTAALKQQMLDKGFPADDIVRVIEARPGGADKA